MLTRGRLAEAVGGQHADVWPRPVAGDTRTFGRGCRRPTRGRLAGAFRGWHADVWPRPVAGDPRTFGRGCWRVARGRLAEAVGGRHADVWPRPVAGDPRTFGRGCRRPTRGRLAEAGGGRHADVWPRLSAANTRTFGRGRWRPTRGRLAEAVGGRHADVWPRLSAADTRTFGRGCRRPTRGRLAGAFRGWHADVWPRPVAADTRTFDLLVGPARKPASALIPRRTNKTNHPERIGLDGHWIANGPGTRWLEPPHPTLARAESRSGTESRVKTLGDAERRLGSAWKSRLALQVGAVGISNPGRAQAWFGLVESRGASGRSGGIQIPRRRFLAMTMRWTSLVPSPISQIFTSRRWRSTSNSRV